MQLDSVYQQVVAKLSSWAESFGEMLTNIIVALLVIGLFWLVSRAACSASDRALRRLDTHQAARDLVSRIVRVAVLLIGVVVALGVMNLDKALASILAGAGIAGLALGFAFQELAGNLISGIGLAIHQKWPFKIGDIVETNDVFGVVEKIFLRTSIIRTLDGKTAIIPNKQIYQNKVINYTAAGSRRVEVECGVSYGDDLEKVERVVRGALDGIQASRDVQVFFTGYGSSSINLVGRFWIDYQEQADFLEARSKAVVAIKQAFDASDIVIPFPIRTLDFGIRGGRPLAEALPAKLSVATTETVNGRPAEAS
jgi:small conductance mechanosensitive channel